MNMLIHEFVGLPYMLMIIDLFILIALELNIFQKKLENLLVIRML